jgi:hypothetical protein
MEIVIGEAAMEVMEVQDKYHTDQSMKHRHLEVEDVEVHGVHQEDQVVEQSSWLYLEH